ncbi:C40 family peptidase [Mycolicibacterium conceptionense]|uniref:C40 family peptidase n=1 Tax=Mycolicibacterium conceptionense TaxID=451644 RepID=UPI00096ECFD6|nr:NlpC/P60 family protein [Mycolicibacterium conceptionense]OMB85378.1 hypothetical protein A5743_28440 [Mycolicibacterium conceptionense]
MTTSDELEQWNLRSLELMMGATLESNKKLKRLGDTLDGSKADLSGWGGEAAEAWSELHGKVRVDIDEQGRQADALFNKLEKIYPEFRNVKNDYDDLKEHVAANHMTIVPPGVVQGEGNAQAPLQYMAELQLSQEKLDNILARATAVSAEIADAMYAACGVEESDQHEPASESAPDGPTTPADQLPLPTKGGHEPFPTIATRNNHSPDISQHLADNAHPSPLLAGLTAGQWRERLAHFHPGDPLPDPRTPTGDKSIDALAHAASQQNSSYAWGGNKSKDGPSVGQGDTGQGANQWHDWDRYGYDCGGLVRYSIEQGAGLDVGMGTNNIDTNPRLDHVAGGIPGSVIDQHARPGDILIFGQNAGDPFSGSDTHHTGLYIGNGYMINAPESGQPIRVDTLDGYQDETTDVLRAPSQ